MKIIRIPGKGEYRFPDDMPMTEIQQAIESIGSIPENTQPMSDPTSESLAMFSPSGIGNEAVNYAPEIGLMAGGLMGAGPMSVPLAGFGYAAGKIVKDAFQGQPQRPSLTLGQEQAIPDLMSLPSMEQMQDMGKGMAMELGGLGLSWLTSKAFKPIQQAYSMLRAGQLAQKGLPIPASAINPTDEGLMLAKKARETWPGNKVVKEAHKKLREGADNLLEEFESKYIQGVTKTNIDDGFNAWAKNMGGDDAPVSLPNAEQHIRETLLKPFAEKNTFWTKKAKSFLEEPTVSGVRNLWQAVKGGRDFDKKARLDLLKIMDNDLLQYGDEAANIRAIARELSKTATKEKPLQGIVDKSYETIDGTDTFMPDKFARLWNAERKKATIKTRYSADEIADIDTFAEMLGMIGSELGKKASDKGIGSLLANTTGATAIGAGLQYATGIPATVPAMSLPIINAMLSNRAGNIYKPGSGVYRQMMGEPMARQMLPGLVNIGGKLMMIEGDKLLKGNK